MIIIIIIIITIIIMNSINIDANIDINVVLYMQIIHMFTIAVMNITTTIMIII